MAFSANCAAIAAGSIAAMDFSGAAPSISSPPVASKMRSNGPVETGRRRCHGRFVREIDPVARPRPAGHLGALPFESTRDSAAPMPPVSPITNALHTRLLGRPMVAQRPAGSSRLMLYLHERAAIVQPMSGTAQIMARTGLTEGFSRGLPVLLLLSRL